MRKNLSHSNQVSNRIPRVETGYLRFLRKRIREGLVLVGQALERQPSERWHDAARSDADVRVQWPARCVEWCREALIAAKLEGPSVFEATTQRVNAFWDQCRAESFAGIDREHDEAELRNLLLHVTEANCDAISAVAAVARDADEGTLNAAKFGVMRAIKESEELVDVLSTRIAQGHRPMAGVR